ncbi:hypothetical protein ABZ215_13795 [Amycolatopsis sp. NPDC006131]
MKAHVKSTALVSARACMWTVITLIAAVVLIVGAGVLVLGGIDAAGRY